MRYVPNSVLNNRPDYKEVITQVGLERSPFSGCRSDADRAAAAAEIAQRNLEAGVSLSQIENAPQNAINSLNGLGAYFKFSDEEKEFLKKLTSECGTGLSLEEAMTSVAEFLQCGVDKCWEMFRSIKGRAQEEFSLDNATFKLRST